jgi:hemerythrin family non-heme iron protein
MMEVIFITFNAGGEKTGVIGISLNIVNAGKQGLVFIVHFLIVDSKEFVPQERFWDGIDFRHSALILEVVLFDVVREVEGDRGSQEKWDHLLKVYVDHFAYEESQFTVIEDDDFDAADHRHRHLALTKTLAGAVTPITEEITEFIKNWLTQHIKNTDFKYKGRMPEIYPIPEPFLWNKFFAVYYQEMDDEHKPLFTCINDIEADPNDASLLASCIKSYEDHFHHEEKLLAESATYAKSDLYQHINKHNTFLATARGLSTPVGQKWIDFTKNWLTQHIINTDFKYKNNIPFPVSHPYVCDEPFQVFYIRLDEEHKVLFSIMQELKNVYVLNNNRDLFSDHFDDEEKQFMACD